jgi:hypothetical protein
MSIVQHWPDMTSVASPLLLSIQIQHTDSAQQGNNKTALFIYLSETSHVMVTTGGKDA